jgi:hypothetical protein
MVDQQTPETTSDTTTNGVETTTPGTHPQPRGHPTPLPQELAAQLTQYINEMSRPGGPLDTDTIRAYLSRVRQFLTIAEDANLTVGRDAEHTPRHRRSSTKEYRTLDQRSPPVLTPHSG